MATESGKDAPAAAGGAGRVPVVKVHAINYSETSLSNVIESNDEESSFEKQGALPAPYPPSFLCQQLENSNCLRQNIDAMCTNVDGFGHRFVPVIDLDSDDADEKIADAMYLERLDAASGAEDTPGAEDDDAVDMPTDAEVKKRKDELLVLMRKEHARLTAWFNFCVHDHSFVELRRRTRLDRELLGYGYWEVLRNGLKKIQELKYAPGQTIRPMPLDKAATEVTVRIKSSPLAYREVKKQVRFRRYLQLVNDKKTYFKEFGDPRVMSAKTGKFYETEEAMQSAESRKAGGPPAPATELICFKVHSPRTTYGVPRWIGNVLSVMGSHEAEEVNWLYWENKSLPPMAIWVEGGQWGEGAVDAIRDTIKNEIKGKRNFHAALVLSALPMMDGNGMPVADGKARIKIQPLTDAMQKDAIFPNYDERNRDKVGESFRIPRILRGDTRDMNRATADAALAFAEQQVFQPERVEFDEFMNRKLLSELDARFHTFESLGPSLRDPEAVVTMLTGFTKEGILTLEEARAEAHEVLGHSLKRLDTEWARNPLPVMLAMKTTQIGDGEAPEPGSQDAPADGAPADASDGGQGAAEPDASGAKGKGKKKAPKETATEKRNLLVESAHLIAVREAIREAIAKASGAPAGDDDEIVVRLPAEVMRQLVVTGTGAAPSAA